MFSKLAKLPAVPKLPYVLLMGGPASGKGIVSEEFTAFNSISGGVCLRKIASSDHPKAVYYRQEMQAGRLISNKEMLEVILAQEELRQKKPILFDGVPRTFAQWSSFKTLFGLPLAVINLSVTRETMMTRLLKRARCDDNPTAIEYRINDYFTNIRPLAMYILAECNNSFDLQADHLSPKEVAEKTLAFLDECGIDAVESKSSFLEPKRRFTPTVFD